MLRPLITSIALALLLSAHATDRVVGPSGTYNTISSAVAASSDGDRVLVASGNYAESIYLSKSLSILPLVEGTKYTLAGSLQFQNADGRSITVSGIRIFGNVTRSGSYATRTEIRILDAYTRSCLLDEPAIRVEFFRDTVDGEIRFSSGTIAGCLLTGQPLSATIAKLQGTTVLPEANWIVGNQFGSSTGTKKAILVTSLATFHVENNVFIDNGSGSSAVDLALPTEQMGEASTILNNSFIKMTAENLPAVVNSTGVLLNLVMKNNAFVRFSGGMINNVSFWPQLSQSNNVGASPTWLSLVTGQPVNGSPLINAGDPDPRYLDLDLTTNDVGCYGGSNSRANFTTGMGGAVVGFMQAPRVVAQGEAVNINATGFDR